MKAISRKNGIILCDNPSRVLTQLKFNHFQTDSILFELPIFNGIEDDFDGVWKNKQGYLTYCIDLLDDALSLMPNGIATICFQNNYLSFQLSFNDFPDQLDTAFKINNQFSYEGFNIIHYVRSSQKDMLQTPDILSAYQKLNTLPDGYERFKLIYSVISCTCPENKLVLDLSAKNNVAYDTASFLNRKYLGIEENIWNFEQIKKAG